MLLTTYTTLSLKRPKGIGPGEEFLFDVFFCFLLRLPSRARTAFCVASVWLSPVSPSSVLADSEPPWRVPGRERGRLEDRGLYRRTNFFLFAADFSLDENSKKARKKQISLSHTLPSLSFSQSFSQQVARREGAPPLPPAAPAPRPPIPLPPLPPAAAARKSRRCSEARGSSK